MCTSGAQLALRICNILIGSLLIHNTTQHNITHHIIITKNIKLGEVLWKGGVGQIDDNEVYNVGEFYCVSDGAIELCSIDLLNSEESGTSLVP